MALVNRSLDIARGIVHLSLTEYDSLSAIELLALGRAQTELQILDAKNAQERLRSMFGGKR